MATRKLTPVQVLQRLQRRVEKRMESLQRVKLAGFEPVIVGDRAGLPEAGRQIPGGLIVRIPGAALKGILFIYEPR
jgi:hypothetical protein